MNDEELQANESAVQSSTSPASSSSIQARLVTSRQVARTELVGKTLVEDHQSQSGPSSRPKAALPRHLFMYQLNRTLNIPPGHLNFWKIFVQIPPSRGRKAVQMPYYRFIPGDQMPPPPGNFSVASIMLRKLCM